ncbi:hypothetical protein CRYUN_Cryun16bG0086100 [Craigia yunnanensis]
MKPFLSRNVSNNDIPPGFYSFDQVKEGLFEAKGSAAADKFSVLDSVLWGFRVMRTGLVTDAFHLTFGCGLLTFSLFAMAASRRKPDHVYTYGYQRLEVLSAFTNSVSLSICTMFML